MEEKDVPKDYWLGSNNNFPGESLITKLSEPRAFIRFSNESSGLIITFEEFIDNILEFSWAGEQTGDKGQIILEAFEVAESYVLGSEGFQSYWETMQNLERDGMFTTGDPDDFSDGGLEDINPDEDDPDQRNI